MPETVDLRLDDCAMDVIDQLQRTAGLREVCAFCVVDANGMQRIVSVANNSGSIGEFEISRSEDEAVSLAVAERGWQIVAFLHTHPEGVADMSPRDAQCFMRDSLPWIIVATLGGRLSQRTYRCSLARLEREQSTLGFG
jgi:proteasome lid subunit RPN8/RPN11